MISVQQFFSVRVHMVSSDGHADVNHLDCSSRSVLHQSQAADFKNYTGPARTIAE